MFYVNNFLPYEKYKKNISDGSFYASNTFWSIKNLESFIDYFWYQPGYSYSSDLYSLMTSFNLKPNFLLIAAV